MSAPRIAPLQHASPLSSGAPADRVRSHELRVFRVTRSGTFGGREWREGQLLVCGGTPDATDTVILAPRGPGNPRLGTVVGLGMYGDRGEPCSTLRWHVSGRLLAVVEPDAAARGGAIPGLELSLPQGWALVYSVAEHGAMAAVPTRTIPVPPAPEPSPSYRWRPAPRAGRRTPPASQLALFGGPRAQAA